MSPSRPKAQTTSQGTAPGPNGTPPAAVLPSTVFALGGIPVIKTASGERREFVKSATATLESFSCHVTTLEAGKVAHAPHRHPDEEIVIVKEGTIEVMINGVTQQAGAGSMFFFASDDLHGMGNAGGVPASYYVLRLVTATTPRRPAAP